MGTVADVNILNSGGGGIPIPDGTPVWVTANSPSTTLPGYHTLTLGGPTNALRAWTLYEDEPLLPGETRLDPYPAYAQIEALAPGECSLTFSFTGMGIATNFNYSHSIPIRIYGVELKMQPAPNANAVDTPFLAYRPGHHAVTNNSKDRIGTHHTTLSPIRKNLLVQVMAEGGDGQCRSAP